MPSNKGTSRRKRDALTPHYCEIPFCGYSRVFQRHRIVPGREGGRYKLGNVIALCPNHHAEADRGWIPREELLELVRLRIQRNVEPVIYADEHEVAASVERSGSRTPEEPSQSDGAGPPDAADGLYSWVTGE